MDMKHHILAALRELFDRWEQRLASVDAAHLATPLAPAELSIKDVIAHLWAWQQRSIARVDAARLDREPEFPRWLAGSDPDDESSTNETNARIYAAFREKPWSQVHQDWRDGFIRFLELAEQISERDLLDGDRYPWLSGYPLALYLVASYDHHQEHLEKLEAWLREQESTAPTG